MSDLIDRQALLKQIDIDSDGEPGYYGDTWKFIDTIKSMPPATQLSTNLAEVGTDCISRQAAIDALDTGLWGVEWDKALAIARLEDLPSAQPEIIRCKDCKYNATSKKCLNPNSFFLVPTDDDFCSYAERREVQDGNDKTTNNTANA